ncbi:C40 family peptidase [Vulcaniibacterium gelatinicum]|uniref:C40 family peptidase n=1 Tax=Vulcaniibacterium gelatinicum TaxID=2598725 RepID=UPI003CCC7E88
MLFASLVLAAAAQPALAAPDAVVEAPAATTTPATTTALATPATDPSPLPERKGLFGGGLAGLFAAVPDEASDLNGRIQGILSQAMTLLGTPYRWGGTSPERGFDCSGLVGYVFRTALGIELPRVSREMARAGMPVDRAALIPGDLVFFKLRGQRIDHVGIYVGGGRFLHAPRRGRDVTVSSLDDGYWSRHFTLARRVAM